MRKTKINKEKRAKKKKKSSEDSFNNFVRNLYEIMLKEELLELSWEEKNDFKIKLSRKGAIPLHISTSTTEKFDKTREDEKLIYIRSPMDGIFYRASSPDAESFVKENDEITAGTTVCIIEAMKLMNEVQVEQRCRIVKVLVENALSINVNQPLFEIENL